MEWAAGIVFVVIIILLMAVKLRTDNQSYTLGSGMFKNSDGNLEREEHLDSSDYDYYNKKGKMK